MNDYVYDDYSYDYDDPYHSWPPEGDYYTPEDSKPDGATTMALSYEEVTSLLETEGFEAGAPAADGTCPKGYYTVGPEGAIPAGLYALEGGDLLSHYYVFDGDSATGKGSAYDLDDSVQYLGNYFVELDEGDLIAFTGPPLTRRRPMATAATAWASIFPQAPTPSRRPLWTTPKSPTSAPPTSWTTSTSTTTPSWIPSTSFPAASRPSPWSTAST